MSLDNDLIYMDGAMELTVEAETVEVGTRRLQCVIEVCTNNQSEHL
jgi:hypothetical protein